jgi:preprotein translocase SecE subunit
LAKTRAQRKAERRARRAREARQGQPGDGGQSRAQHDTQVPESGEVAEAEAVLETGGSPEELGESVRSATEVAEPEPDVAEPDVAEPEVADADTEVADVEPEVAEEELEAAAPSRADVGVPAKETREERRARRQREKEKRRDARAKELRKAPAEREERRRGAVLSFLLSCWAELKRVQWPDRETLVQASAVTVIFIAVAAAYLGALDAFFNWLVKLVL